MQRGPWLEFLEILPEPFRWIGTELTRIVQWWDQALTRALISLKASPGWFFVTTVGIVSLCLSVLLFASMSEPRTGRQKSLAAHTEISNRSELEKADHWSSQDRWRIAHLFVSHKPLHPNQNIRLDSRLMASDEGEVLGGVAAAKVPLMDVRLDLDRPRLAQQDHRLVKGAVRYAGSTTRNGMDARVRERNQRLLVQAAWTFNSECKPIEYSGLPLSLIHI